MANPMDRAGSGNAVAGAGTPDAVCADRGTSGRHGRGDEDRRSGRAIEKSLFVRRAAPEVLRWMVCGRVRPQLCEGSHYYSGVAAVKAGTVPGSVFRQRGTRVHAVSCTDVSLYNPMAKEWRW